MPTAFTIVTKNRLHGARLIMADVAKHLPAARRVVFLADHADGLFDPAAEPFEIVPLTEFAPSNHRHFAFALSPTAFCCMLKPHAAIHLRSKSPLDTILYLDADTTLLNAPDDLLTATARHSVVLTPHVLDPAFNPQVGASLIQGGVFNAGLFALGLESEADHFLAWWVSQLSEPTRVGPEFLYDQAWLNAVPSFFPSTHIFRHPGYNVAYWNLHERSLGSSNRSDELTVNGRPLVLFHFSGLQRGDSSNVMGNYGAYFPPPDARWSGFGVTYAHRLREYGADTCEGWDYGFARFHDEKPITPQHRSYFVQRFWSTLTPDADPFDHDSRQFGRGLKSLHNADHPLTCIIRWGKSLSRNQGP